MDRSANRVVEGGTEVLSVAAVISESIGSVVLRLFLRLHRLVLSPLLGPACRFEPSCSRFAEQAIDRYGCRKGVALGAARLIRCHPWGGPGGFDPVP